MSHREVSICRAERVRVEVFIGVNVASTGNFSCHAITGDAGRKTTFLLASLIVHLNTKNVEKFPDKNRESTGDFDCNWNSQKIQIPMAVLS